MTTNNSAYKTLETLRIAAGLFDEKNNKEGLPCAKKCIYPDRARKESR